MVSYDQDENIVLEDSETGENPQQGEGYPECTISLSEEIEEECEYYRIIIECNYCGDYERRFRPSLLGEEDISNEYILTIETEFLLPVSG